MSIKSLVPRQIIWGKLCFVYCGPERCNCGASATKWEREQHEKEEKEFQELLKKEKKKK